MNSMYNTIHQLKIQTLVTDKKDFYPIDLNQRREYNGSRKLNKNFFLKLLYR